MSDEDLNFGHEDNNLFGDQFVDEGPSEELQLLMEAMGLFAKVLREETQQLRKRNMAAVNTLAERKTKASRLYIERLKQVAKRPEQLDELEGDDREQFIEMVTMLKDAADENSLVLKARMTAIERVLGAVADAVTAIGHDDPRYLDNGIVKPGTQKGEKVAVSVNTTI